MTKQPPGNLKKIKNVSIKYYFASSTQHNLLADINLQKKSGLSSSSQGLTTEYCLKKQAASCCQIQPVF
jgi:hypothetical protein